MWLETVTWLLACVQPGPWRAQRLRSAKGRTRDDDVGNCGPKMSSRLSLHDQLPVRINHTVRFEEILSRVTKGSRAYSVRVQVTTSYAGRTSHGADPSHSEVHECSTTANDEHLLISEDMDRAFTQQLKTGISYTILV